MNDEVVSTQEIIGTSHVPTSKVDIIAYYLEERRGIENVNATLLIGAYHPTVEDKKRLVFKFKPFAIIPVLSLQTARELWSGKVVVKHEVKPREKKKEKEQK